MARPTHPFSADRVFAAFADRTRLRLLNLLRGGERCVCVLVDVLKLPQPTVSRHLGYLRRCGLVIGRKEGLWVHYRLAAPATELQRRLLDCLECCLGEVPELVRDARRADVHPGKAAMASTGSAKEQEATPCCDG